MEFNGSSTVGCSTNASTCHPLVQYFGVWNEPDGLNNFLDTYYDPGNLGNYLNDFVNQYLTPAHNGVKAANSSAYVVAADLGTGSSVACGGFSGSCSWDSSWMKPLSQYFTSYYDVISIHGYNAEQADKSHIDEVWNNYDPGAKPIWMTETAYGSTSDLTNVYVDQHNRDNYWTKVFYEAVYGTTLCSSNPDTVLFTTNNGATWQSTAWGTAYEQAYAPH